jgi:hypothetical protein
VQTRIKGKNLFIPYADIEFDSRIKAQIEEAKVPRSSITFSDGTVRDWDILPLPAFFEDFRIRGGNASYYRRPNDEQAMGVFPNNTRLVAYEIVAYKGEYWVRTMLTADRGRFVYIPLIHTDLPNTWDPKKGEWLYMFRGSLFARKVNHGIPLYFHDGALTFNPNDGPHRGVDIFADAKHAIKGYPVYSVGHGTVVFASDGGSLGYEVVIKLLKDSPDDPDYFIRYAHLNSRLSVSKDDKVTPFTKLGYVDKTGRTDYYHLHFEVRKGGLWGTEVNPMYFLQKIKNARGERIIFTNNAASFENPPSIPFWGNPSNFSRNNLVWREVTDENCRCNVFNANDPNDNDCRVSSHQ